MLHLWGSPAKGEKAGRGWDMRKVLRKSQSKKKEPRRRRERISAGSRGQQGRDRLHREEPEPALEEMLWPG